MLGRYKASFVIVEEGGYEGLFANLADAKQFTEGQGRIIQLKNINSTGMQWQDIPILMFVNNLHDYMRDETFLMPGWD